MKLLFKIIALILALSGVPIFVQLHKYIKDHGTEQLEDHESYIVSRFKILVILELGSAVVSIISIFIP